MDTEIFAAYAGSCLLVFSRGYRSVLGGIKAFSSTSGGGSHEEIDKNCPKKGKKQAGAELGQAQLKLGLNCN